MGLNSRAIIAILVIIVIVLIGALVRLLCWGDCKRMFCPNGCCVDDPEEVVITQSAPSPRSVEGEEGQTY